MVDIKNPSLYSTDSISILHIQWDDEIWSCMFREQHTQKMLRRMFVPKRKYHKNG
jgi:hypothetical protein